MNRPKSPKKQIQEDQTPTIKIIGVYGKRSKSVPLSSVRTWKKPKILGRTPKLPFRHTTPQSKFKFPKSELTNLW